MAPTSIKLTYFDIEGAGEPVRLALALSGTDYEDERIKFPEWAELKPKTPHGTLPILTIDGEVRVQSHAMLRWIGTELAPSLYPKEKLFDVEEAVGLLGDFQRSFIPALYMAMRPQAFGYPPDFAGTAEGKAKVEELRKAWVADELPKWCKYFADMMDSKGNGQWLATTDGPSIADCVAVPMLRNFTRGHVDHIPADCLEKYPKIVEYIKRFCALEQVKGRYDSGVF